MDEYRLKIDTYLEDGTYYAPQKKIYILWGLIPVWSGIDYDGTLVRGITTQVKLDAATAIKNNKELIRLKKQWKQNQLPMNTKYESYEY